MSLRFLTECCGDDLRFSARLLRKNPGFAAAAIFTLALGIGANTALFSITDLVLLRPLSYPHPERLVRVWQTEPKMGEGRLGAAPPEFLAYRARSRAFSTFAGYQMAGFDITGGEEPAHLSACRATAALFPTLGIAPLLGRTFTADEERTASRVAVLGYSYWRRHYAEDPLVLGKLIRLNEQPYQIIGVMPKRFAFPSGDATPGEPPALWTPLSFPGNPSDWASSFDTSMIGRLKEGVSPAQARDDVRRVAVEFQREHADIYSGNIRVQADAERWSPNFDEPWSPGFTRRVPAMLWMLCGAAGFVLLIACANVANLLLARSGTRQREISIRRALGATPAGLLRQMLAEVGILAVAGGIAGCALADALLHGVDRLALAEINIAAVRIDSRVLVFTLGLSALTCLLCGLAPGRALLRLNTNTSLKESMRQSGANRRLRRMGRWLILAEIACSVILLVGTGLLVRSFVRVLRVPLGFDPEHTLIVRTAFNHQRYASSERRHAAERTIEARLASLSGVSAVALTTHVPLADARGIGFALDGRPPGEFHWADNALVSAGYFRLMQIPLLAGRSFSDADSPQSPLVAVINHTMARQYWPNQDPVGKGFRWGGRHLTVIGVVGDIHVQALDKSVAPMVYNSVYQIESGATTSAVWLIRTPGPAPLALAAPARSTVWSVDRGLPILGFSTLHEIVSESLAMRRISLDLVAGFALLAMVLALIGIYGVLSQIVTQRTAEMGIRQALGATPIDIRTLVVSGAVRLATGGIVIGLGGAAVVGKLMAAFLFETSILDPLSFAAGVLLLFGVTVLASYVPARRASRVDPLVALRYE